MAIKLFDKTDGSYVMDLDGDDMTFDTLDEAEKFRDFHACRHDACVSEFEIHDAGAGATHYLDRYANEYGLGYDRLTRPLTAD
jgi:hypothetical protein